MNEPTEPLDELASLAGMRAQTREPVGWAAVGKELGFDPPPDYRELIDRYGSGMFGFWFEVLGPDDHSSQLKIDFWDDHFKQEWRRKPEHAPQRPGARDATIVRWGGTEDAHIMIWLVEPDRPATEWLIGLQNHDGPECEYFEMTTIEFLLAFVKDELDSELLSSFDKIEDAAYLTYAELRAGNG